MNVPSDPPPALERIFAEVFSIPAASVTDDLDLRTVATWDSMAHMVLITRLETEFNFQLSGDEIADLRTVGDARAALRARNLMP